MPQIRNLMSCGRDYESKLKLSFSAVFIWSNLTAHVRAAKSPFISAYCSNHTYKLTT